MKKFLLFTGFLLFAAITAFSQTIVFHEDFELPGLADSVVSTQLAVPGTDDWGINTRMHQGVGSLRSDTCQVKTGITCFLTSDVFSTLGFANVELTFSHVCKIDPLDIATIEVSVNGGTTWTQLTGTQYLGTGGYVNNGNKFASNSYGATWAPSTPATLPLLTWFKSEKFDISNLLGNCPTAKFRFKLADGGTPGPGGNPANVKNNRGWYVDNISVKMSYSELLAPTIVLVNPIWTGVTYNTGPYQVRAKVNDFSGLDTVMLVYSLNNGVNDTLGMTFQTSDTNWVANIPLMADSSHVCYYVIAYDASPASNFATNPIPASCVPLTFYAPFPIPYNDNFDAVNSLWEAGASNNGNQWQWGSPNFGATNSTHSPPKAWDVNLTTAYADNGPVVVVSPPLNFSNAFNARLSFWYNCNTQATSDGFRLEYSTNAGATWTVLGQGPNPNPDPLGINWYTTSSLDWSGIPGWEGSSGGWKQAKYKLSVLNNQTSYVRLRFSFYSNGWQTGDGVSIDDFSIVLPAPQEAAADKVMAPATGCGLGLETVKVRIINNGLTAINGGLTASYKRDAATAPVTEPVTQAIPAGDTIVYTFTTPVNLATVGVDANYNLKCWVTLTGDPNHGDDTTFKAVTSQYIPVPPTVSSQLIPYGTPTTVTATSPLPVTWYSSCNGGTNLWSGASFTTPILYGMMIYYPKVVAPNGCESNCAQDTVFVSSPPPFDGAALTITSPVTGFNLLTPQTVKVLIRNYGTSPMVNVPIKYSFTGQSPTPVVENFPGPLASNDTITYTFTAPANIAAYGSYLFKAWVEVSGDLNHINDTATAIVENKMFNYCQSEATSTGDDDIGNVTVSNLNNGIATPSTSNPTATNTYSNFTATVPPILMSRGLSYPISVTQIDLNGWYGCWVKVFVDWNWNGTFEEATETAMTNGLTTSSNFTLTGNITVPANAHLGLTRFRVVLVESGSDATVHACGTYSWGETEDYLVMVSPQLADDAGATAITMPPVIYPEGTTSQVVVTVKNYGLNTITPNIMDVSYKIDNGPTVVTTPFTGTIIANATGTHYFPAIVLPSGNHTITAWTTLPVGDTNYFNDTTKLAIYGIPIDPLPYYDNFDTANNFTTTNNGGTNWVRGIPSPSIFPNTSHSPDYIWGTNLNNTAGYGNSANCSLTSQLFTFNNAMNAKLSFWMKRRTESTVDGCTVEFSTDNGNSWQTLGTVNDPNGVNWFNGNINGASPTVPGFTGNSTQWTKAVYKLSLFNAPFVGEVRFRYRFISNGWTTDNGFFLDDFEIFNPYMTDAGIDSIYTPNGTDAAGYPGHVKVRLNNFSRQPLTAVNISYKIGNQAPVTALWTGNLAPGDTVAYTFATPFGIPQGDYCVKAYTSLPNDSASVNDTSYKCAFGIPVFDVPFVDNFDSITSYWYTSGTQWERGTPTGTNASINAPYSPTNCWKTNIDGPYALISQADLLYSPMFNLSYGYDSLTFYHWVDIYQSDQSWVDYLSQDANGNKIWKRMGNIGDINGVNWYNSGSSGFINNGGLPGWHRSAYDLKILFDIANPAQFRFHFHCFYNNNHTPPNAGWAVDNFELTTPKIPLDAGVVSIIQPTTSVTYGTDLEVIAKVRNFGTDTLFYIPLKYSINGTTVAAETWSGVLLPDSSINYTFQAIESPLSSFDLCVYTDVPFDTKLDNDTTCTFVSVVAPPYDVAITQIIAPIAQTIWGDQTTVTVRIKNFGFQPVTSIPLEYRVADTGIVVNETWNGSLNQNEEATFSFATTYNYDYLGFYYLCVITKLANDGYIANDTLCSKVDNFYTFIPENPDGGLYLAQNYPNPSDGMTEIGYSVPGSGEITFGMVNYLGQRMLTQSDKVSPGEHKLMINTSKLPAGMYYYYIVFEGKRMIRKMVITH